MVRYRQDDDQRSSRYDDLLAAEAQAIKSSKGVHGKKDVPSHRINDLTADSSRIKQQYLPSWQRALRSEGIVEFVASGSRLRVYISKDSCLITFLLGGISCPRSGRPAVNGAPAQDGEPFGDEALQFTRDRILQRDVSIHIDSTDKAGSSCIGWLWTENNTNLSVALVEEGLASVHFSAEKTEYFRELKTAEDAAKKQRKRIWANYVEEVPVEKAAATADDGSAVVGDGGAVVAGKEGGAGTAAERKVAHEKVVVTEIVPITKETKELRFFAQHNDHGAKLEQLMSKLRQDFIANPPITGAYTPKRGELVAARFSEDNEWYRAKVERVQGGNATILYIDYGNKEVSG